MKKVVFLSLLLMLCTISASNAKAVKVEALSDFSTANPPQTWSLKIIQGFVTKDGYEIAGGSEITGKIDGVTDPKRLKRNATFNFIPYEYYDSKTNKSYPIDKTYVGNYSSRSDITAGSILESGAVIAGSHFISGFIGPSVALVKGAVKNEEGNRAKSAAISVYESTPISYIEKGHQLEIKKGQVFIMNFKIAGENDEQEDKPNYSYTMDE